MKPKDKKRLEWTIGIIAGAAILGTGAYLVYEHEYANPVTLAPGIISSPTPSGGRSTFELPSGAKSWSLASQTAPSAATLTVPTSATSGLNTTTPQGSSFAISWVDSTGATQATTVNFT